MERFRLGAFARTQRANQLGYFQYSLIAGIVFLSFSGMALTFVSPKWSAWVQKAYGEGCERQLSVLDPCFKPLPLF